MKTKKITKKPLRTLDVQALATVHGGKGITFTDVIVS
jgi:hypothetical protein